MKKYLIVIEKAAKHFSAYSPDLPGCVASGKTRARTEANMLAAIRMHLAGLAEDGLPAPEPSSTAEYVTV